MPRKTKKEKLRTDRKEEISPSQAFSYVFTDSQIPQIKATSEHKTYIRRDIAKTVIIATIFITFEILLSVFSKKIGW